MSLFAKAQEVFELPNADLIYRPKFIEESEASDLFNHLINTTPWQQDDINIFGKTYAQPRLTALYGVEDKPYSYSGITMHPHRFTKVLLALKHNIEEISSQPFTSVLLNLYRDGNDSNGWHADNEKELGKHPVIASLSLGESRWFHFKHRTLKQERHKLLLEHGSLLIMKGEMQEHWLHQIAKTKRKVKPRVNLTFRKLINL
ncbi:alpha-ketoglutarate-dependent dioxygenase AlkB [Ichthyenterobacterium sp. W332]|uniref:Alpha-ketoglutarate-dependent dioxygenase AlkB n=1 Tax=Microcosmobacter mediterraneus TaxID=3075607 RepID=A0ABU2YM91_9FLAO|nr:alpha-ketoglutarate-dependent dioxygenase AlkB [Ichthyenterobacterium sp. W332]MDT0559278.1 alpha-ketoglutarate-dependent dioxygenase AlkB [Ichthyenterobacterium sp. W332]